MLKEALKTGRTIHFIHCARNKAAHAFRDVVDALAARHPQLERFYCYDQATAADSADAIGLLDQNRPAQRLPVTSDVDAYFLGPKPYMALVKRGLQALGVPEQQTRHEFFGPASALN